MVAEQKPVIKAAVFGIKDTTNGRAFAVIKYKYSVVNSEPRWDARVYTMQESELSKVISKRDIEFINVDVKNGSVIGKGASLDRFKKQLNTQIVIGVMTVNGQNGQKVIGYRIVNSSGIIRAVKIADIIKFADKASKQGQIPFQNAVYVQAKDNQSAFLRAYTEGDFIQERHIYSTKAKQVVDDSNTSSELGGKAKATKSLSEIYTRAQLVELKAGKSEGLPVRVYANPELQAEQMHALRSALQKRINPQRFASPEYGPEKMRFFTTQLLKGNRINEYLNPEYSYAQLIRLAGAVEMGLDVRRIANPKMSVTMMDDELIHMELEAYNQIQAKEGKAFSNDMQSNK